MITVKTNQTAVVKVNLNPTKFNSSAAVDVIFSSPTRPTITLSKSLSELSGGFFSFNIDSLEGMTFVDDSYSYRIEQNNVILKYGKVRVVTVETDEIIVFDYTLDFTLS